jgi:carboxypeptidase C (cathepsin A)
VRDFLISAFIATALCISSARADESPSRFVTNHVATVGGQRVSYTATVEDFLVNNKAGKPAARLFTTSYIRAGVGDDSPRPVVFLFNGGPSAAAIGVHMQFGPIQAEQATADRPGPTRFVNNPDSLLDVADLVAFDPAETGFSRVLNPADRDYFYSTEGDTDALAQLVIAWTQRHGRKHSPLYLLGESYGSIRQVIAGSILAKQGVPLRGQIILGDSIFLQETSRRTHNIISTAVSVPMLAITAAYHGKADKKGKTDKEFLDEVYAFAMGEYLSALAKGYTLGEGERRAIAERLSAYIGIPVDYLLGHALTIAKQDFNRQLLAGQLLNANDTRLAGPLPPPPANAEEAQKQQIGKLLDPYQRVYSDYMANELKVNLPGAAYQIMAPDSFDRWDWGPGCNAYLQASGLCNPASTHPSVFMDYDYPETLKHQFEDVQFRTMIVSGYYDGLSSVGTHRYLAAQLGYPRDRFSIHEYPAGHATAADPVVRPQVLSDLRNFLNEERSASRVGRAAADPVFRPIQ